MPDAHLSPSALNRFLGCQHRTYLDVLEQRGELDAERRPPRMELLFERGERFEDGQVRALQDRGLEVRSCADGSRQHRAAATLAAMRAGVDVIHQGCFVHGQWVGFPDFLIRVDDAASNLGAWSYEVHDAKVGSH